MGIIRNDSGSVVFKNGFNYVNETYKVSSSFNVAASPLVCDLATTLTPSGTTKNVNGNLGYIICDGPGDILVEISHDGNNYTNQFTVKTGESFSLSGMEVAKLRITHSGTDSSFRVNCF